MAEIITPPNNDPLAPLNHADAESCDERQTEAAVRGALAAVRLALLPLTAA